MLDLATAERSFVLSLLRQSHETATDALARYANLPPRLSSESLVNEQWRELFDVVASNANSGTATTPTLAAQQTNFTEFEIRNLLNGVDPDAVKQYSQDVLYYAHKRLVEEVAAQATEDAEGLNPDEAVSSIMARFAKIDISKDDERVASTTDRCDIGLRSLMERREAMQSGQQGLEMPLAELDEKVPYIMPGSMILVTAQTGCGKSTFAAQTYDYHLKQGGRGLFFHFEDTVELVWLRRVARQMRALDIAEANDDFDMLPTLLFSDGSPPSDELREELNDIVAEYGEEALLAGGGVPFHRLVRGDLTDIEIGKVRLVNAAIKAWGDNGIEVYAGGWTMDQVIRVWLRYELKAGDDGYDFVVIDYLNKARLPGWVRKDYGLYSGRGRDAERLKLIAERTGAICMLVQQEKADGDPYETQASRQKSQLWLSLKRESNPSGGWSNEGRIIIRKANAGQTGGIETTFNPQNMVWEQA